jgi:hypothetical protein
MRQVYRLRRPPLPPLVFLIFPLCGVFFGAGSGTAVIVETIGAFELPTSVRVEVTTVNGLANVHITSTVCINILLDADFFSLSYLSFEYGI